MIFVTLGLGQLLMMEMDLDDVNQVVAAMVLIIVIGYVIDGLVFRTIEKGNQRKWDLATSS